MRWHLQATISMVGIIDRNVDPHLGTEIASIDPNWIQYLASRNIGNNGGVPPPPLPPAQRNAQQLQAPVAQVDLALGWLQDVPEPRKSVTEFVIWLIKVGTSNLFLVMVHIFLTLQCSHLGPDTDHSTLGNILPELAACSCWTQVYIDQGVICKIWVPNIVHSFSNEATRIGSYLGV